MKLISLYSTHYSVYDYDVLSIFSLFQDEGSHGAGTMQYCNI